MNIFDNIVYNENKFTELFRNYLILYKEFRDAFVDLIYPGLPKNDIDENSIFTQVITQENGRPDLVIETKSILIFIEIKVSIYTTLTGNQPEGYLSHLEKNESKKYKSLILLYPENYYLKGYEDRKREYLKGKNDFNINTLETSWSELINKIEKLNLYPQDTAFQAFKQLMKDWFEPKPIVLTQNMIEIMYSNNIPQSLQVIMGVVNQVEQNLQTQEIVIENSKNDILKWYGFEMNFETHGYHLFFGEWFAFWDERNIPLCFGIMSDNNEIKESFSKNCEKEFELKEEIQIQNYGNWLLSDINLELYQVNNNFDVQKLISKIMNIIQALQK
jgi:hypothetical protein